MVYEYKVAAFVPEIAGCGAQDRGWDRQRCQQFKEFLNTHTADGWKLHSSEYREVAVQGCGGGKGTWLVCIFEKTK